MNGLLDADADPAPAEDLRGEDALIAQGDQAAAADGAVDLEGAAVGLGRGEWGWPGGAGASGGEVGEVVD